MLVKVCPGLKHSTFCLPPFTDMSLWTTQCFHSISECSHFFELVEQKGAAQFSPLPCFFYSGLFSLLLKTQITAWTVFPSSLLSLTLLWDLPLFSSDLSPWGWLSCFWPHSPDAQEIQFHTDNSTSTLVLSLSWPLNSDHPNLASNHGP